jgi:hypothetical protein
MSLIFKNDARSLARRVTMWLSFNNWLIRQLMVVHLFFASFDFSFPRFVGLLSKLFGEPVKTRPFDRFIHPSCSAVSTNIELNHETNLNINMVILKNVLRVGIVKKKIPCAM